MARRLSLETVITAQDNMSAVLRNVTNQLDGLQRKAERTSKAGSHGFSQWGQVMKGVLASQVVTGGFNALRSGMGFVVNAAKDMENSVAQFIPKFGGDIQRATGFVKQLNKVAADTPFEFADLAKVSDMLMGFGVATEKDVIPQMKMLGDLAGGNADKFNHVALAYSQSMAAGKANMQDMNQLINAGVPILGELAKMYGVNVGQIRKMIEQGKILGPDIQRAFQNMTSEGGMFYRGMEIASKTFSGKLSTLRDNLKMAAVSIGGPLLDAVKPLVDKIGEAGDALGKFFEAHKPQIINAVNSAMSVAQKIFSAVASVVEKVADGIGKGIEKFGGLNRVMSAVGGVIDGIVSVFGAVYDAIDRALAPMGGMAGLWKEILEMIEQIGPALKDFGNTIGPIVEMAVTVLKPLYDMLRLICDLLDEIKTGGPVATMTEAMGVNAKTMKTRAFDPMLEISNKHMESLGLKPMFIDQTRKKTTERYWEKPVQEGTMLSAFRDMAVGDRSKSVWSQSAATMKQAANLDVNVNVNQDGRVTSANVSKRSAQGFRLIPAVAFNP